MRIERLTVSNFRGLEELDVEFDRDRSVVVGPNAIGKTTILESVRLVKSILCPRYGAEPQTTLQSLGALSPHHQFLGPKGFDYANLAGDVTKPLNVSVDIRFTKQEHDLLTASTQSIAFGVLQSQTGRGDDAAGQLQLTQFLSSQDGQQALRKAVNEVSSSISSLSTGLSAKIELTVDKDGSFRGNNIFLQQAVAFIERSLNPDLAKVSYLPADRALPQGEIAIQLGSQNAQAEVQSHLAQAHQRYARLKNSIAQSVVSGNVLRKDLENDFKNIFDELLPGKTFKDIEVNQLGILKVVVEDKSTGKSFDIDSMSSGEKGLILTFMFIKRAIADDGILLLDEPESHLNSSVCRRLLKYLVEDCCKPRGIQSILCTHSPEVVADAYGSDDCRLFHLRSGRDLSPIYRQDTSELFEIFDRLGSSAADVLFSAGNVFVEGDHDADILREGFDDIIGGYAITQLGGRAEVEKAARDLKKASKDSEIDKIKLFILDNDGRPTTERPEGNVRILQWERYCLENYLLDDTPIYEVTREFAKNKPASRGEFDRFMRNSALKQIEVAVAKKVYSTLEPENPGLIPKEIKGKSIEQIADVIASRIERIRDQLSAFDKSSWTASFVAAASEQRESMTADWDKHWQVKADGKKIIDAIFEEYKLNIDKSSFKRKVMLAMKINGGRLYRKMRAEISASIA